MRCNIMADRKGSPLMLSRVVHLSAVVASCVVLSYGSAAAVTISGQDVINLPTLPVNPNNLVPTPVIFPNTIYDFVSGGGGVPADPPGCCYRSPFQNTDGVTYPSPAY